VTGGEKVASAEVEAVIYELPAVSEVAVFGSPDPQWGERVTACVVLKPGTSLTTDEVSAHCRRSLAGFKCPRRIEFSSAELPKDGAGKVLKRELREGAWAHQPREVA
jgi:acyl-CoA synthetase (AMP-forming)/AMP-acid ligase II